MESTWKVDHLFPAFNYKFLVNVNCSDPFLAKHDESWYWPVVYIFDSLNAILVLLGIFLNCISIIVMTKASDDGLLGVILKEMAVCDICVLLINALDAVCHSGEFAMTGGPSLYWFLIHTHPLVWVFQSSFVSIKNWSMVYMTVSRSLHIVIPFKARKICSKRNTIVYFVLLWCGTLSANSIKFLETNARVMDCPDGLRMHLTGSGAMPAIYSWLTGVVFNALVPVGTVFIANVFLLLTLAKSRKFRKESGSGGETASDRKAVKLIVTLSIIFLICQTPICMYGLMIMYISTPWVYSMSGVVWTFINDIDSSTNFFIYVRSNPKFKEEVDKLFGRDPEPKNASGTTMSRT